ncbi:MULTISPECIES: aspartate/glutamate racemase family protein [unclassified Mycolicibacterium]|uniref:aspartate/glutamate racemase family protein n=1 Tax=unclassified Mycolicibacterium TaxID=2636767 RepID=UPI0012DBFF40|nr:MULTISPECIES: aspartate/glutamate racemase family protein [unclassified Mycolicibacterium]MUL84758.1 aspartate/glutamate racemase family protein [Mycolicibacterium sp. CBMA 329]MUL88533.1 aspartate/glutamate racemase family protein [Mycolicibacterium sp. CBMA 331]MUM00128.1 aspartate/glutamate racemase family protein [Mycolicibacterium sp. CBMA 334]MUM27793.1 aspartate/glutamate racemase family protein [Mycolicibacterium sp. CBMA 295]MUM40180.1 aspartate/glutamate racemase family protein [M
MEISSPARADRVRIEPGQRHGRFRARPGQVAYGYPIGMLCAQWNIAFVPGDLNHASTFDFPVRYLDVPDVVGAQILRGDGDAFIARLIEAARRLESEGVRAITSNCGFMAVCQEEVAAAVDVPVFMSSLLQVPMLTRMVGRNQQVGVLAANSEALTESGWRAAGVADTDRPVVEGLERYDHFREVILEERGLLDLGTLTDEVVQAALNLVQREPNVGALLLECSDLPVYSQAIHDATGLPVFDWASFIDYVHRAVVPRTYAGIY